MGKTGRTKTNREKKKQELHVLHNQQCCANHSFDYEQPEYECFKIYNNIICGLFRPIVYMNVLTTGGFCTDSLKATTTPQIHHLICQGRKSKCSVQTVHSFE